MKLKKNVSNREIKDSLLESLSRNEDALDYIKNQIYKTENILGYDPLDKEVKKQLETERYIEFCLKYLEETYTSSLKKFGVVL